MQSNRRPVLIAALLVTATIAAAACDRGDGKTLDPPTAPPPVTTEPPLVSDSGALPQEPAAIAPVFTLVTPWQDGQAIPARHTCDDIDVSPGLSWTGVTPGAIELALVVVDEDAEQFIHWVVIGIPTTTMAVLEGTVPTGGTELTNDFGELGWAGPCPPPGTTHTYRFTLHALNQQVEGADDMPVEDVVDIIESVTIGSATVYGTFTR